MWGGGGGRQTWLEATCPPPFIPEPGAEPPLLELRAAKWPLLGASWDHPQGLFSWLRTLREHVIVAMSLPALAVSQNIPNVGRKEEGSDGTRFSSFSLAGDSLLP